MRKVDLETKNICLFPPLPPFTSLVYLLRMCFTLVLNAKIYVNLRMKVGGEFYS